MATITPLIEYLMALSRPGGGRLVRFGVMLFTIPILPPEIEITVVVTPYFNSFVSIEYWHRFSPAIVPGTVNWIVQHTGVEIASGIVTQVATVESHNFWMEITESNPSVATITNLTRVNQFWETLDHFLIINSEEDYLLVKEIVRNWGAFESVAGKIDETNYILRQIAGGAVLPRPPAPILGDR